MTEPLTGITFVIKTKTYKNMKDLSLNKETMSSIEVSELTGKRHDAILRDIRNLLGQGVNAHNFVEVEYVDKKGEARPCFELTKKGCLILASGYDAKLREKIIDRWEELELDKSSKTLSPAEIILQQSRLLVENERKMRELEATTVKLQNDLEEVKQRTTANLNQSTIVAYVTRNNIKLEVTKYGAMGRKATSICKKRGIEITKINDVRWGMVSVYPDSVLDEVFNK